MLLLVFFLEIASGFLCFRVSESSFHVRALELRYRNSYVSWKREEGAKTLCSE